MRSSSEAVPPAVNVTASQSDRPAAHLWPWGGPWGGTGRLEKGISLHPGQPGPQRLW